MTVPTDLDADLRIDANFRTAGVTARAGIARAQGGALFQPSGAESPVRAAGAAPTNAMTGLDAILTLQCVEDALHAPRKKAVRRGRSLLDGLEAVRADLLVGRVGVDRLDRLMDMVAEAREQTIPGLDALLDDIELRVRVELAKFGRYPAF